LVWLWPEELPELTDRGASRLLEKFLLETFADDFGAFPVFCLTEEFFTALLFIPETDLLVALVAEVLSTPERLLFIDLLWADLELFILRPSTVALSRVLAFCPEFVLE
jgi:hypothetical protein